MTAIQQELIRRAQRSCTPFSIRAQRRLYVLGLGLVDVLMILLAFGAAYAIRFNLGLSFFAADALIQPQFYLDFTLLLLPVWLALYALYRMYDYENLLGGLREYAAIFNACVSGTIAIAVAEFFTEDLILARGFVGMAWVLTFMLCSIGRFLYRRLGYNLRRHGKLTVPAIILGVNSEAEMLGEQLNEWPTSGLNPLGFLDDYAPIGHEVARGMPVIGRLADLDELVEQYSIGEIILVSSVMPRPQVLDIFQRYGTSPDVHLRLSSGLFDLINTGLNIKEMGFIPLIGVNRVRLTLGERILKRILDVMAALAALILGAPLFLLLALAIKLDTHGPVIYRRRVMGLNNTQFDAFKFRTMLINGDEILKAYPEMQAELEENYKLKDDPRITRVGAFLRKFSLDELPQFYNILRGEMSLVGPRMISPPEVKKYGKWALNLLTVRPGLTGLWQVSGRSEIGYEERVRLDMFYIRNYSLWLDLQLILRTIPAVLLKKGAF
jgi:exopolysaccharide biosynthesis polyprenyl glycosylphosphotransferase